MAAKSTSGQTVPKAKTTSRRDELVVFWIIGSDSACAECGEQLGRGRFLPSAVELAVRAHVRHAHPEYDQLLANGADRSDARTLVSAAVETCLDEWRRGRSMPPAP